MPDTLPVASTVATVVVPLVQVPIEVSKRDVDEPTQTNGVPVIGAMAPLTVIVIVTGVPQPFAYVIVVVPPPTPETSPEASTVATLVVLLVHVPPVDASANVVTAPTHAVGVPVIATGAAFTVTVAVAGVPQPLE